MDIVYSSSDSYCDIAGISILSLLEHNRNVKELNLYLIDNQISAENKQKLTHQVQVLFADNEVLLAANQLKRPFNADIRVIVHDTATARLQEFPYCRSWSTTETSRNSTST